MQSKNKITKEREPFLQKMKGFGQLLIKAGLAFAEDKCMKMSASLAYYTVFSIGPLIIIIIWALGFLYGDLSEGTDAAKNTVFNELNEFVGPEIGKLLEQTIQQITLENKSNIGLIIGTVTLIITSTTIFVDIQHSINTIWKIKVKPKKDWLKMLINRLISFSMIVGLSFLLMASLLISSIIGIITKNIEKIFHFVLAALARIQEKQGDRQKSIYLHAHDRRTKQHHHYDTDAQCERVHPRTVNTLEEVRRVCSGVKQGSEYG